MSGGLIFAAVYYAIYARIIMNLLRLRRLEGPAAGIFIVLAILALDVGMVTYNSRLIPLVLMLLLAHTSERLRLARAESRRWSTVRGESLRMPPPEGFFRS